jgi:hypothetical protein
MTPRRHALGNIAVTSTKWLYFLDPMFIDEVSTTKEDTAIPLMNMTEKVFPIIYPDATPSEMLDIIAKAMGQWGGYRGRSLGLFAKENVWAAAKRMSAVDFWNVYGSHCPELAAFAICILSSHVTSSSCERGWNRYKFIKSNEAWAHAPYSGREVPIYCDQQSPRAALG